MFEGVRGWSQGVQLLNVWVWFWVIVIIVNWLVIISLHHANQQCAYLSNYLANLLLLNSHPLDYNFSVSIL